LSLIVLILQNLIRWLLFWFQDNDLDVDVFSLSLDLKLLCLYMSIDLFIGKKSMLYEIKCDCLCICRKGYCDDLFMMSDCVMWLKMRKWWYVCIHRINWEFMNMIEIMRLFEYFGMKCIVEFYVLQMTYRLCMRLISRIFLLVPC
jgi:hypothetical protein